MRKLREENIIAMPSSQSHEGLARLGPRKVFLVEELYLFLTRRVVNFCLQILSWRFQSRSHWRQTDHSLFA
jgi:hypothetical protein